MSNSLKFILALTMLAALLVSSCSRESTEANSRDATASTEVTKKASETPESGTELAMADPGETTPTPTGDSAADAYAQVLAQVKVLEKEGQTPEGARKVIPQFEKLFKDFLAAYPESPQAADANFQLGMLYVSTARPDNSIPYLAAFIDMGGESNNEKLAYAHYYVAEAYKNADQFDKARLHFNMAINEYGRFLQPQFVAMAQTSLQDLETLKQLTIGSDPIPFEFTSIDGEKLSLEQLKGKVVLLDFWATWCAPCRAEMPNVVKLHKKYKDKGFAIVGISLDRDKAALMRYLDQQGMDWPQQYDGKGWQNEIATKYKVRSIPATYLIDRAGKIRYRAIRGSQLEEAVAKLLDENA